MWDCRCALLSASGGTAGPKCWQLSAEFSPSLHSALPGDPPQRLWAFYGSSGNTNKTQNPSPSLPWAVGQAYSDHGVMGPWVRDAANPLQLGGGIENPLVIRASCGPYSPGETVILLTLSLHPY